MTNLCEFCKENPRDFHARRCTPCRDAFYVFRMIACGRRLAAQAIQKEVRAKRLLPARQFICVDCERRADEYDHRDYSKPLEVEPVCRSCNLKRGHAIPKAWTFDEFMARTNPAVLWRADLNRLRIVFERLTPIRDEAA